MNENFVWIILLPFGIWFWMSFFKTPRPKNCPDCGQPLSLLQSPFTKTKRMWFEGGHLCSRCGCEVNLNGQKVPVGTPPQPRSVTTGVGMIVIAVVPALVMLSIISQSTPPKLATAPQALTATPQTLSVTPPQR